MTKLKVLMYALVVAYAGSAGAKLAGIAQSHGLSAHWQWALFIGFVVVAVTLLHWLIRGELS